MPAGDGATRTASMTCQRCGADLGEIRVAVDEWYTAACIEHADAVRDVAPDSMTVYVFDTGPEEGA